MRKKREKKIEKRREKYILLISLALFKINEIMRKHTM